jgi:hypothetical protein
MRTTTDMRQLVRRAQDGRTLDVDSQSFTLDDLTQIAVALQPGADLLVHHASRMTPIERACLATHGKGRIIFFG